LLLIVNVIIHQRHLKNLELVLNNFVVKCLFAYACFLGAVPIVNVDQHFLDEPRALLIPTALSSNSKHILETDCSGLILAFSFNLFQFIKLRSFLSSICFRVEFISGKAASPLV
jgi:hypothetical protein